tara:strand:- start:21696 stop:22148 length:453 start_codon:yes stop_codon:yes gene_type:complete
MAGFSIFALQAGGGVLALSPQMQRSDIPAVAAWAPDLVVCMVELHELDGAYAAQDVWPDRWAHFPVQDYGVPDRSLDHRWDEIAKSALEILAGGGRVLVHCHGGCGRSGMAVLRLMIAAGEDPDVALARLRGVRPCAVETEQQMLWAKRG